jgi:hypothetical protein
VPVAASEGSALEPSLGLLLFFVSLLCVFLGGGITAAKGRFVWLALGLLLTGGFLLAFTAFLMAKPASAWARAFYGPAKMARARERFPAPTGRTRA